MRYWPRRIFLELRESAYCVRVAIQGMSSVQYLSDQHFRDLETDTMAYLGIIPLQWFNSCGNMTLMHPSQNSSKNVWTHTVILALREPGIGSALGGLERCKTSFS